MMTKITGNPNASLSSLWTDAFGFLPFVKKGDLRVSVDAPVLFRFGVDFDVPPRPSSDEHKKVGET